MENVYPIFVPSKGRALTSNLLKATTSCHLPITVVVEPQESEIYAKEYMNYNILVLEKNDQGITYVRNEIKEYAEKMGLHKFWMMDDDINGFFFREGNKMIKSTAELVLLDAQDHLEKIPNLGIGALEYQQLAWSATKEYAMNSYCDVCVLIDNERTAGQRYRPYLEGKEDRDFAMQTIAAGMQTARTTLYAFSAPKNGSNAGGLKETFYDKDGREAECSRRMIEVWGNHICQLKSKPDGRPDVRIKWKLIGSAQQTLF